MPNGNGGNGPNPLLSDPGFTWSSPKEQSDWSWVGETVREWSGQWLVDKKIPVEYSMTQEDKQMLLIGALVLIVFMK